MDLEGLASTLFNSRRAEEQDVTTDATTRTYMGVAVSDSVDGTVRVDLGGDVTLPDDLYDEDGNVVAEWDGAGVEVPTSPQVRAGQDVIVTLVGGGATKAPMVTSAAGSGDSLAESIDEVQTVADAAEAVANATAQHVWTDTNGLHVTEVEQDEWEDSEGASYHSGMNVLINSLGQLFRSGLNNLLAIVSGSSPAVAIYDGQGNADSNIVARFASDLIELGKNSSEAVIKLCGGLGSIGYNSSYYGCFTILGNGHDVVISGGSASARLDSENALIAASDLPALGAYIRADVVTFADLDETVSESFPVSSVINAIPVTLYDNASASVSASATLSESAANFKRLTIFFKDINNNYSSTEVWSPNGKRVALSLTWINGASTQDMYQRVRWVTISGRTISTSQLQSGEKYRTGQIKLNGGTAVENSDYIAITHVIGYR